MYTIQHVERHIKQEKETIHSGQFMVSQFEAEEQDDEDNLAVPVPEDPVSEATVVPVKQFNEGLRSILRMKNSHQQLEIDTSLSKLFQCMSLAYRQKLTSPKWNRFRGIRLRWKDKIRLNNVIWRCWHMQFIKKENTLICQFASPLETDTHNKPEAVVLEGKYWKRKLAACTAEYKKWRMFYRNHASGHSPRDGTEMLTDVELLMLDSSSGDGMHMMVDEDYMGLMSDTLFSTITNQPFVFPDSREIAKAGLAEFIQPSLGPLQPNLDEFMDTFEPLQEFMSYKLPPVPEEQSQDTMYKSLTWNYSDIEIVPTNTSSMQVSAPQLVEYQQVSPTMISQDTRQLPQDSLSNTTLSSQAQAVQSGSNQHSRQYPSDILLSQQPASSQYLSSIGQQRVGNPPSYQSSVISKNKQLKRINKMNTSHVQQPFYNEVVDNVYHQAYSNHDLQQAATSVTLCTNERLQMPLQDQAASAPPQTLQQSVISLQNEFHYKLEPTSPSQSQHHHHRSSQQQQQPQQQQNQQQSTVGYKFTAPSAMPSKYTFTSQQVSPNHHHMHHMSSLPSSVHSTTHHYNTPQHHLSKDDKMEPRIRSTRGRQRSRSNTREPIKRPPLLSAVSDPSLVTPTNNALLTQLLTNNTDNVNLFARRQVVVPSREAHVRIKKEDNSPIPILPQPPPTPTTLIITPVNMNTVQSQVTDPLLLTNLSSSNSPNLDVSSQNINSPTSSQGSIGSPNRSDTPHRDHRRVGHIHAEQKRRYNIKNGFDMLHSLIPHLNQNPNAKLSKAAMLQKGAEYIRQLKIERSQIKEEMDTLKQQIDTLNTSISNCQSMLPATGAPVSRRRDSKMQEMFDEYVKNRTMENWKFWIFSLLFRPLLASFNAIVSTSSLDDLYRTTMLWIEQHCTLVDLRPVVLNSLRYLCTKTEILSEPEKLPEEARQEVLSTNKKKQL